MKKSPIEFEKDMKKAPNELLKELESFKDAAKDAVEEQREQLIEAGQAAAEKVKEAISSINDSVHRKPWTYLGGALLMGFLVGILSRSKYQTK